MNQPHNIGNFDRLRLAWRRHKDSPGLLGTAMATIAVAFIIGIVAAFNSARLDSMAHNPPPATTASAPASKAPPAETTGSGNRPSLGTADAAEYAAVTPSRRTRSARGRTARP